MFHSTRPIHSIQPILPVQPIGLIHLIRLIPLAQLISTTARSWTILNNGVGFTGYLYRMGAILLLLLLLLLLLTDVFLAMLDGSCCLGLISRPSAQCHMVFCLLQDSCWPRVFYVRQAC